VVDHREPTLQEAGGEQFSGHAQSFAQLCICITRQEDRQTANSTPDSKIFILNRLRVDTGKPQVGFTDEANLGSSSGSARQI
jgi:hypothetical protein